MRPERPDELARLAIDDGYEIAIARIEDQIVRREARIALVIPMIVAYRLQIIDMEIVRVFRALDELQLLRRETDLVEVIGGRPGPGDVAIGIYFIGDVVQHLWRGEARQNIRDIGEQQRVAIGQARNVMMLPRDAAGSRGSEGPHRRAIPIDLADRRANAGLRVAGDEIPSLCLPDLRA